jgi:plasmid stabilization system protein ParE
VKRRVTFRPQALLELFESADWYEARDKERGRELSAAFLRAVDNCIEQIQENPFRFPLADTRARRAVLPRFPYSIIYTVSDDEILIVACFHGRRNPRNWRKRL